MLASEYRVSLATDGQQARDAAQREIPDVILSDVRMLGMDGIELTSCLRAHPTTAAVPIILLSGCNRPETRLKGLAAGANEYMLKPFRPKELLACLRLHSLQSAKA